MLDIDDASPRKDLQADVGRAIRRFEQNRDKELIQRREGDVRRDDFYPIERTHGTCNKVDERTEGDRENAPAHPSPGRKEARYVDEAQGEHRFEKELHFGCRLVCENQHKSSAQDKQQRTRANQKFEGGNRVKVS
jgi:hypothetical protein